MRSTLIVFCTALLSTVTFATNAPQQVSTSDLQLLLDRIDKLEKRVAELEAKQGSPPSASAPNPQTQSPVPAPAPVTEPKESRPAPPAEAEEMGGMHTVLTRGDEYPNLKIRGFADVDFSANDHAGTNSGFQLGQFVLHFASALSPKISYFAEVSLTATPGVYNVDLERTIIRYDWNDLAKLSFGRYHTPINYWNTAFHHGAWLQTTISRPDMVAFGGRFIPVHFIGAQSEGSVPSGALGMGYNLGIGNGRSTNIARGGDFGDVNNHRAWLGNFYLRPPALKHLQLGGSVYNDEITLPNATPDGQAFREWTTSGHLIWTGESPEFFAEFANVHHHSITTNRTFDNQGGYVQFAYRLPFDARKWKPYYRYDYLQVPANEPTLPGFTNVRKSTLGIRYDISDFAAFKAEYRNGRGNPLPESSNAVAVQTAFTF